MKLAELLSIDRVIVPLVAHAAGDTTLASATRMLVERLVETGSLSDGEKLREAIDEERDENVVTLNERAFITHFRTDTIRDLVVAVGMSPTPVRREMRDGEPQHARVVLLILAPPRSAARQLQVLGAFERALAQPEIVQQLVNAPDAQSLVRAFALSEAELPDQLTVRDIMTERPRTVAPETLLRDAAREIARTGLGALPVLDRDGLLIGMLSERELMRYLLTSSLRGGAPRPPTPRTLAGQQTVREVMTRQVLCVSPDQPLAEVAALMTNKDVDRLPVVREGRLVGLLTRGDIVRKLLGQ